MAVIAGYQDKDGKPTTDPSKAAYVLHMNQWAGQAPTITRRPLNSGYGESNGSNYFAINDASGNPAGAYNPLAYEASKGKGPNGATPSNTLFIGDSIAHREQLALHQPDFQRNGQPFPLAIDGDPIMPRGDRAGIKARIESLTPDELKGKNVVLSLGSNDIQNADQIPGIIKGLTDKGVDPSNIKVLGYSTARGDLAQLNPEVRHAVEKLGAAFVPLGAIASDSIHQADPQEVATRLFSQAARGAAADPTAFTPTSFANAMPELAGGVQMPAAAASAVPDSTPATTTLSEVNGEVADHGMHGAQPADAGSSGSDTRSPGKFRGGIDSIPTVPPDASLAVKVYRDH